MTDTKQLEERDKFKAYFEQNLLDGDKLGDSGHTMLQADEVFEVVSDYITAAETAARIDELKQIRDKFGVFRDQTLGIPVDTKAVSVKDINRRMDELRLQNQTGGSDEHR